MFRLDERRTDEQLHWIAESPQVRIPTIDVLATFHQIAPLPHSSCLFAGCIWQFFDTNRYPAEVSAYWAYGYGAHLSNMLFTTGRAPIGGNHCSAFRSHLGPLGPNSGSGVALRVFFFYADMFSALLCWMAACSPGGASTCPGFRDQAGAGNSIGFRQRSWLWWAIGREVADHVLSTMFFFLFWAVRSTDTLTWVVHKWRNCAIIATYLPPKLADLLSAVLLKSFGSRDSLPEFCSSFLQNIVSLGPYSVLVNLNQIDPKSSYTYLRMVSKWKS